MEKFIKIFLFSVFIMRLNLRLETNLWIIPLIEIKETKLQVITVIFDRIYSICKTNVKINWQDFEHARLKLNNFTKRPLNTKLSSYPYFAKDRSQGFNVCTLRDDATDNTIWIKLHLTSFETNQA